MKEDEPVMSGFLDKKNQFYIKQKREFVLYLNGEIRYYEPNSKRKDHRGTIYLVPSKRAIKDGRLAMIVNSKVKPFYLY